MLAYACFALVEFYVWLVVVLWAYSVGGASLASVVALAQLLPASLLAPAVAGLGDRLSRGTALAVSYTLISIGALFTSLASRLMRQSLSSSLHLRGSPRR